MTSEQLLERLLNAYQQSFDITRPYTIDHDSYDAYGAFDVTSEKYVLTKKAVLWRAQCYEHAFFRLFEDFTRSDLERFQKQIIEHVEPNLVRKGGKYPPEDHMYTYITGIFICETVSDPEVRKAIRKFKYMKNYLWTIRGYCDARLLIFDLKQKKVFGNHAARDLVKGYKKIL